MLLLTSLLLSCDEATDTGKSDSSWACVIADGESPNYANQLGCQADYDTLSSEPADASIPGATSVKTVIDRSDGNKLYFQNSKRYCVHWDFCSANLSGDGLPIVGDLSTFNTTEYYSPDRRFILGALSYYSGPDAWVYEISPYDTADADMITTAYRLIQENAWIGDKLYFHPSGEAVEAVAATLPSDVKIMWTDDIYAGVDYQPLNTGISTGILKFYSADDVDGNYTPYRELVVLDSVPNDISIVAGVITAEFQTPLAHINVLSVNRGTPNMALRGADTNEELKALEGKWVQLDVEPFDWTIKEITEEEADAWWEENKPTPLAVQPMNLETTDLRKVEDVVDLDTYDLADAISEAIPSFGAKGTNYGALYNAHLEGLPIPIQDGFVIPMYYYNQFMEENGFWDEIEGLMASAEWDDPDQREAMLESFQDDMRAARADPDVVAAVKAKAAEIFPGELIRFRSSTNSEDLGQFTGAGLYNSETGDPSVADPDEDSVEWAMKKVWSQVWNPRAYEERSYYGLNHLDVGMALLVHANFPDEEANGVAVTNNPFDTTGLEGGFYVNAQEGSEDVVSPAEGVTADAYIHYFYSPGQPIVYLQHSNLIPDGETVLTNQESYDLAVALDAIHSFFYEAYGVGDDWYAMDVEWKYDDKATPGTPTLYIKQARPYPGWETDTSLECTEDASSD